MGGNHRSGKTPRQRRVGSQPHRWLTLALIGVLALLVLLPAISWRGPEEARDIPAAEVGAAVVTAVAVAVATVAEEEAVASLSIC